MLKHVSSIHNSAMALSLYFKNSVFAYYPLA